VPRITKRLIDTLEPGSKEYSIWDDALTGFAVRVQPSGAKSYVLQYRAGGGRTAPKRRLTLGRVGDVTPDQARKLARTKRSAVVLGADPAADKAAARRADTLKLVAEAFLHGHVEAKRKPSTASFYRLILNIHVLPYLGARKAKDVSTADLARLHRKMAGCPHQANRMLAVLSSLYTFARKQRIVPPEFINPARDVERYREQRRERFLSSEELARLGEALREAETVGLPFQVDETKPTAKHSPKVNNRRAKLSRLGPHAGAALRLLLFTGARLREILHLRWEDVDLERGLLLLPDSKTGQKPIVLNAPAMAVLASIPQISRYVIAGQSAGTKNEKPRADLKAPWRAICKFARLPGVRIHDLRHTHASFGAGAGLGLPIIGRLLGHTQPATTQRYAHLDADPLRRASNVIGFRIASAMGEAPAQAGGGEVVSMARR
jgi:integrase